MALGPNPPEVLFIILRGGGRTNILGETGEVLNWPCLYKEYTKSQRTLSRVYTINIQYLLHTKDIGLNMLLVLQRYNNFLSFELTGIDWSYGRR